MSLINLKISQKMAWGGCLIIAAFVGMSGYAWLSINALGEEWQEFSARAYARRNIAADITRHHGNATANFKNYILRNDQFELELFSKEMDAIEKALAIYKDGGVSADESVQLARIASATAEYRGAIRLLQDVRTGSATIPELDTMVRGVDWPFVEPLARLNAINRDASEARSALITEQVASSKAWLIAITIPVALLVAGFGLLLSRSITRPLQKAVEVAKQVAAGDLTSDITVRGRDEAGQMMLAMKAMNESLQRIVSEVRAGTEAIAIASREIVSGNTDLSQRTEEQASSLEETAASIEELTSTVRQNADSAKLANDLAQNASEIAARGGTVVGQVVTTMGSINQSSRKIVDIISVIDGIAFQTNILALNAAVEAARAGEQGRGFAVVAGEVRSLAQRSAAAAKEIKTLIGDSVAKVEAGGKLVDEAGKTMGGLVVSIQQVTDIMNEILVASNQQRAGIEQVNQAILQMDKVTQQNAALVEQSAAAAESLQDQAHHLADSVRVFKLRAAAAPRAAMAHATPARSAAQAGTGRHDAARSGVAPKLDSSGAGAARLDAPPRRTSHKLPPAGAAEIDEQDWKEF